MHPKVDSILSHFRVSVRSNCLRSPIFELSSSPKGYKLCIWQQSWRRLIESSSQWDLNDRSSRRIQTYKINELIIERDYHELNVQCTEHFRTRSHAALRKRWYWQYFSTDVLHWTTREKKKIAHIPNAESISCLFNAPDENTLLWHKIYSFVVSWFPTLSWMLSAKESCPD